MLGLAAGFYMERFRYSVAVWAVGVLLSIIVSRVQPPSLFDNQRVDMLTYDPCHVSAARRSLCQLGQCTSGIPSSGSSRFRSHTLHQSKSKHQRAPQARAVDPGASESDVDVDVDVDVLA